MQQHKENMAPNSVSKRQSEAMTTPARAVSSGLQRKLDAMKAAQEASESSRRAAVRQTDHLRIAHGSIWERRLTSEDFAQHALGALEDT